MERLSEMTRETLLSLTDEDIKRLIDLECAEAGVPLLPLLPGAPEFPEVNKDLTVYRVGSWYFLDREKAEKLTEYLNKLPRYESAYIKGPFDYGGPETVQPTNDPVELSPVKFWSREFYATHSAKLDAYRDAKKRWDEQKSEYDKILRDRESYDESIRDAIAAAWTEKYRLDNIQKTFDRYLDLADGNLYTARRFLDASGRWSPEEVIEALGEAPTPPDVELRSDDH